MTHLSVRCTEVGNVTHSNTIVFKRRLSVIIILVKRYGSKQFGLWPRPLSGNRIAGLAERASRAQSPFSIYDVGFKKRQWVLFHKSSHPTLRPTNTPTMSPQKPTHYKRVVLNSRPVADIEPDTFRIETLPFDDKLKPGHGQVLIKVLWVSLDPAMRGWLREARSYLPPVEIGAVRHWFRSVCWRVR